MFKVSGIALIALGFFSGQALADDYGARWGGGMATAQG